MIIYIIIGYAFLVIFTFIPLYKKKLWSDFWVNTILGVLSLIMAVLISFNVNIPSPAKPLEHFITLILGK